MPVKLGADSSQLEKDAKNSDKNKATKPEVKNSPLSSTTTSTGVAAGAAAAAAAAAAGSASKGAVEKKTDAGGDSENPPNDPADKKADEDTSEKNADGKNSAGGEPKPEDSTNGDENTENSIEHAELANEGVSTNGEEKPAEEKAKADKPENAEEAPPAEAADAAAAEGEQKPAETEAGAADAVEADAPAAADAAGEDDKKPENDKPAALQLYEHENDSTGGKHDNSAMQVKRSHKFTAAKIVARAGRHLKSSAGNIRIFQKKSHKKKQNHTKKKRHIPKQSEEEAANLISFVQIRTARRKSNVVHSFLPFINPFEFDSYKESRLQLDQMQRHIRSEKKKLAAKRTVLKKGILKTSGTSAVDMQKNENIHNGQNITPKKSIWLQQKIQYMIPTKDGEETPLAPIDAPPPLPPAVQTEPESEESKKKNSKKDGDVDEEEEGASDESASEDEDAPAVHLKGTFKLGDVEFGYEMPKIIAKNSKEHELVTLIGPLPKFSEVRQKQDVNRNKMSCKSGPE